MNSLAAKIILRGSRLLIKQDVPRAQRSPPCTSQGVDKPDSLLSPLPVHVVLVRTPQLTWLRGGAMLHFPESHGISGHRTLSL